MSPGYRLGPFPFALVLLGVCFKSRALCALGGVDGLEKNGVLGLDQGGQVMVKPQPGCRVPRLMPTLH